MFLIGNSGFLPAETGKYIISGHAETFIKHILHLDSACLEDRAQVPEIRHLPPETALLRHGAAELFKIISFLGYAFHTSLSYRQICPISSENPNICGEIIGISLIFFSFLSKFLFFKKIFLCFVGFSCLSGTRLTYNFADRTTNEKDMDNTSIKNNIRKIRKARKITQEEMAHRLGISVTAYRDFEKGGTSIVNGNVMKLADLLDTSTEELVLGYRPSQIEGTALEEVRHEYGNRISTLDRRVADLEKLVESLEETIRTKNEIIKMLKKRLGEVE